MWYYRAKAAENGLGLQPHPPHRNIGLGISASVDVHVVKWNAKAKEAILSFSEGYWPSGATGEVFADSFNFQASVQKQARFLDELLCSKGDSHRWNKQHRMCLKPQNSLKPCFGLEASGGLSPSRRWMGSCLRPRREQATQQVICRHARARLVA